MKPPRGKRPAPRGSRGPEPRARGGRAGPRAPGPPKPRSARPQRGIQRLEIVHEDEDVIVVNKPAGLLSAIVREAGEAPGARGKRIENLFDLVKQHVRTSHRRGGRAWIVHRLDKEVSGLLVFAKTHMAFDWLKEDFRAKRVHRLYAAVVEGEIAAPAEPASASGRVPQAPSGTIQSFLEESDGGVVRSVAVGERSRARGAGGARPEEDGPRFAVTHWRIVSIGRGHTMLQVRLETGRKNQIRVHMSDWKHPIVGDRRYGARFDPLGRLALHAGELGFTHPRTGRTVRFTTPAPHEFYELVGVAPPRREAEARPPEPAPTRTPAASTSWDQVAEWYDQLLEEQQSDHFEQVILPGALRLLQPRQGVRMLDVACGQGRFCRELARLGAVAIGVDASPRLVEAARRRDPSGRYEVADARELPGSLHDAAPFDAISCIMALMNMDVLENAVRGCGELLKPGGRFVAVILHPAFRAPGQTSWGWDQSVRGRARQYRRIDGYLSPGHAEIVMNPGRAAHGQEPVTTLTFHRPIQAYVKALADAGLVVDALEEWPSRRQSQPGPRASEENRARREIPMFLALRALRPVQLSGVKNHPERSPS